MVDKIANVYGREIMDSRGNPTLEVEVLTSSGLVGRAAVPSGASTGAHEAHEMRDQDAARFLGKGVLKACQNVNEKIGPEILGVDVTDQAYVDKLMLDMDGTANKASLGANAILGVSMALAQAAAKSLGLPAYRYLGGAFANTLPVPLMNVLNGGAHANNGLSVQEFMIVPCLPGGFRESLRAGAEVFQSLKKILHEKSLSTAVGDEGGFAPKLSSSLEALDLLLLAIEKAGYKAGEEIGLALDVAATEFYREGKYHFEGEVLTGPELSSIFQNWCQIYPIWSIEDALSEDDWSSWEHISKALVKSRQLVGDDLFVTNTKRLAEGISKGVANALLVKVNQIGTLSETHAAVRMATAAGYKTVMSHRSGETEDTLISDLAVAFGCQQIKTGSLCRGERTSKYNQLLRIEEDLGGRAEYLGRRAFIKA